MNIGSLYISSNIEETYSDTLSRMKTVGKPKENNIEKSEDEASRGKMYFMNELLVENNTTNTLFKTPCSLINTDWF